jgi:hypothetical protein
MAPKKQDEGRTRGRSAPVKAKVAAPKRKPARDPTRDAPFRVDVANDGDIAAVRHDPTEDEIKEQADREKAK